MLEWLWVQRLAEGHWTDLSRQHNNYDFNKSRRKPHTLQSDVFLHRFVTSVIVLPGSSWAWVKNTSSFPGRADAHLETHSSSVTSSAPSGVYGSEPGQVHRVLGQSNLSSGAFCKRHTRTKTGSNTTATKLSKVWGSLRGRAQIRTCCSLLMILIFQLLHFYPLCPTLMFLHVHAVMFVMTVLLCVLQRDEQKCPALPNACTCMSESNGLPGPQGPVVSDNTVVVGVQNSQTRED